MTSLHPRGGAPRTETWAELLRDAYFSFDRRTLGLTRVCLGFFLVMDLFRRASAWTAMFGDHGVLPTTTILARPQAGGYSFLHGFSTPFELWALFVVILATYVCLLVGYRTKLAQILAAFFVVSLNGRVLLIENGGYVVQNLLLLWTAFLPLGDRFSVDALLASFRRKREIGADDLNERRDLIEPWRATRFVSLVGLAICFQLGILYYFNVVHKTGSAWSLRNATAVHTVMYVDRMVNPGPAATRDLVPFFVYRFMGRAVIVAELAIPFLLFTPIYRKWVRRVALVLVCFLHIGFGSTFVLGPFAWSLCVFSTLLFSTDDWEDAARAMRRESRRRTVLYDPTSGAALWIARLVARMDRFGLVGFVEADGAERARGILVERPDGSTVSGSRALSEIVQALPAMSVFGRVLSAPGVRVLVDRAMARGRWSRFFALPSTRDLRTAPPVTTPSTSAHVFGHGVALAFAAAFAGIMGHQLLTATTILGRAFVILFTMAVVVVGKQRWRTIAHGFAPVPSLARAERPAIAVASALAMTLVLGVVAVRGVRAEGAAAAAMLPGIASGAFLWRDVRLGLVFAARWTVVAAICAAFAVLAVYVFGAATKIGGRVFVVGTVGALGFFLATRWWVGNEGPRGSRAETRLAWFWSTVRELLVVAFLAAAMNQALTELWATRKHWNNFVAWLNTHTWVKAAAGTISAQPDVLRYLAHKPRYLQGWFMFSPNPVTDDATLVVDAITVDGRHVDPFWGTPPNFDLLHARSFGYDQIWSDYFNRIQMPQNRAYRDDAVAYMRRLPERTGNPNDALVRGEVYWVHDMNPKWGTHASWSESRNLVFTFGPVGGAQEPPKQPEKTGAGAGEAVEILPD